MSSRRGNNEGSIYQRSDGQWCASLTVGYDEQGKRCRRTVYASTKNEVIAKLTNLQIASVGGTLAHASGLRVAEFLTRNLEDAVRPSVRPRTYQLYKWLIEKHINPRIGGVKLDKLSPLHVQQMMTTMEGAGASGRLRQMAFSHLKKSLKQAMKWGLVPRNVCDAIDKPKAPRKEFQVLDEKQVREFLKQAKSDRLYAMYVLAVTTGMRQGELLGLHWKDVNLKEGAIAIRQILQENNEDSKTSFAEPKSAKSRRRIDLPDIAIKALREHRKAMLKEKHYGGLVFPGARGKPIRKSNLIRRSFHKILEAAKDVPKIRFHDLRHTAATLLLGQGVHPKVVQERLGHASISLTLDTYSHVLPSMQKDATAKLNQLFGSR